MKKVFVSFVAIACVAVFSFTKKAETLNVNTTETKIEWVGTKKSGSHPGSFSVKSGTIMVESGKLTGGKFVIDLASLKVLDGAGAKLEGHLKGADFFDFAAKGTDATYEITSVNYASATTAEINGTLTLKGITAPVSFTSTIAKADGNNFVGDASFNLDRTTFGINYGIGNVENNVALKVHLVASK
jgi:polyisoprenoid-binding protein YceI